MAPAVFGDGHFEYIQEHLRVLSAFYGVLKPMDGVTPYRLEMQAKAVIENEKNLYDYWGDMLYKGVRDEKGIIINLASKEYSKCIERYLSEEDTYISITFYELSIENPEEIKKFNRLGYVFREDLSTKIEYVFERRL